MIIEVRKAGFQNKGAHLMLLAIVERLRRMWPEATLVMVPSAPGGSAPYADIARLGFGLKSSLQRRGLELGDLAGLLPARLRHRYGLYVDREVDVVLDAAGFAYSDQWGVQPALELARATRRWRRRGTKVILMPQAFGPFGSPAIRRAIASTVDNADLVMPRESSSYRHLTEISGERNTIRQYPDFTNLIAGVVPNGWDTEKHGVAVVPNCRMLDMTDEATSAAYLPLVCRCVSRLQELNAQPFLLIHEGADDTQLAQRISAATGNTPVVKEYDPLKIKGILGASRAVVASRFHALVSALSQGVPAVATGWSHKYNELFNDYGFPEGVMAIIDDADRIDSMMLRITETDSAAQLISQLLRKSARLKELSEQMWTEVRTVIEGPRI
jgi:colanic acid/amylovoran biosynthesis protein